MLHCEVRFDMISIRPLLTDYAFFSIVDFRRYVAAGDPSPSLVSSTKLTVRTRDYTVIFSTQKRKSLTRLLPAESVEVTAAAAASYKN